MQALRRNTRGFTLIEIIIVIVIAGVLAGVALRSASLIGNTARTEETKRELENLASAIIGDPNLHSGGVRADFGYIGDIGALPPDLDALVANPGLATWHGPYISNSLAQSAADFKTDPWGALYTRTDVNLISTGSGSPIVRPFAGSESDLLRNAVAGVVLDADGTPPGSTYADSLLILLTFPNGAGGMTTRLRIPDIGGFFSFDSIPIGNHDLRIIYQPGPDTLNRFVSVTPGSSNYSEYILAANLWPPTGAGGTGLTFVDNSDTLTGGQCNMLNFAVTNASPNPITISAITLTWAGPSAYYRKIDWDGVDVYSNPPRGSGDQALLITPQTMTGGATAHISINQFKEFPNGGGASVNVTDVSFTITFSDGGVITFVADVCD